MPSWKDKLSGSMAPQMAAEIDAFESEIALRKQGKLDEKVFAETRLRRGCYGQRYDNGHRHDGEKTQQLHFPSDTTKGPDTLWDAPGMQRIKIPYGGVTTDQMDVLADLAEEYADSVLHVTTRQDFQLHYVHIDDTPELMRRLAAVGITTREACGNSVRNVTACPLAGICRTEAFNVAPYARAAAEFMLGHPDAQGFGRKFKIAFSGCAEEACGLVNMHDMGAIAVKRVENGVEKRGFETYVGGGLGAVPHDAKLFDAFLPAEELLPITQAIARVFARLGEKKNRAQARVKFLVARLGIDEFRRLVLEERKTLQPDPRWTAFLKTVDDPVETPLKPPSVLNGAARPAGFDAWYSTNVYRQKQPGYVVASVSLPLGDLSSWQMRELARIARRFSGESVRTTVEQNMILRWVSEAEVIDLYKELSLIGLGEPGAGSIVDVTACPGTDTCKLGISSSRGLAAELRRRLAVKSMTHDSAVRDLRIKISGCFNSCGQHHVADLGFYGVTRAIGNRKVPHFQVVVGGQWQDNGGAYGLALGAPVPSKRIPETVDRITERYVRDRQPQETFQAFIKRIGKKELRDMLADLTAVPSFELDPSFYSDWGDPRVYTIGDMGTGECAGEVVSVAEFDMAAAERLEFEAQLRLDSGDYREADGLAYRAMLEAARSLVRTQNVDLADEPEAIVREYRARFYDTPFFPDRYAGNKFAEYLFRRHAAPSVDASPDSARRLVEEAQLFIEAAHAGHQLIAERSGAPLLHAASNGGHASKPATGNVKSGSPNTAPFRLGLKFYAAGDSPAVDAVAPVFYEWIQKQAIPGHLLIDVHDYTHIDRGPHVLLVAHEGNFCIDSSDGRAGLLYTHKTGAENLEAAAETAARATIEACRLLEAETALRFRTDEALFIGNDRLLMPNDAATTKRLQAAVQTAFRRVWPNATLEATAAGSRERLALRIRTT